MFAENMTLCLYRHICDTYILYFEEKTVAVTLVTFSTKHITCCRLAVFKHNLGDRIDSKTSNFIQIYTSE